MQWIKWECGLARKPEVLQIATALGIHPNAATGHLMALWEWADGVTVDGIIHGANKSLIDTMAGIPGIADAMAATIPTPWLVIEKRAILLPNFTRHNGESAKKRAQAQKRVGSFRTRL